MGESVEISRELFDPTTGRRYAMTDPAVRVISEAFVAALPKQEITLPAPGPVPADAPAIERPIDADLPVSDRLNQLVWSCDYRGATLVNASCKCTSQWHCLLGLGDDPAQPHNVTVHRCYQCVLDQIPDVWPEPPPVQSDVEGPGALRRVANFLKAAAKHVAAGAPKVSVEEASRRLAICETNVCGFYRDGVCQHPACGCTLIEKTRWATERCPLEPALWSTVP